MANIETYEKNLETRLTELRQGDRAYEMHQLAIQEAIVYAYDLHGYTHEQRILDCGCGLGFTTARLAELGIDVTGIDPSKKTISMAIQEHKDVPFYQASAESFPNIMAELNLEPFDQVILNMVLHSVDNQSVLGILTGIRECLRPEGTILIIVPTQDWLVQKLIEYAQDQEMERTTGVMWVGNKMEQHKVEIPVKIRGGEYYSNPLTIYNRTLDDYGDMLRATGFGVRLNSYDTETKKLYNSQILPYWNLDDFMMNIKLVYRQRELLMSFALVEE
ncbi:class I SAM-dependent methyltransferase [Patescibacteria group bacterium]|nr:class I SAM-dependent methyltransferase [Patescibacteria group bacterium]